VKRTLYLLRHAKSSWDDPSLPDYERPLARRGRRACARLASHLQAELIEPQLVLCSSAVRARETLMRLALPSSVEVRVEDSIYGASAAGLLAMLRALPESIESALVVGHDPGIQELALLLARPGGLRDEVRAKFPTGALATLALTTSWGALTIDTAELTAFVTPRQLR